MITQILKSFTDARIIKMSDEQGSVGHPLAGMKYADWPHDTKLDFAAGLEQWAKENWPECYAAIAGRGATAMP